MRYLKIHITETVKEIAKNYPSFNLDELKDALEKELQKIDKQILDERVGEIVIASNTEDKGLSEAYGSFSSDSKDISICFEAFMNMKTEEAINRSRLTLFHELGHAIDNDLDKINRDRAVALRTATFYGNNTEVENMFIQKVSDLTIKLEKNAMENGITFAGEFKESFVEANIKNLQTYQAVNNHNFRKILNNVKKDFGVYNTFTPINYNVLIKTENSTEQLESFTEELKRYANTTSINLSIVEEKKDANLVGHKMKDLIIEEENGSITMVFFENKKGRDIKTVEEAFQRVTEMPTIKEIKFESIDSDKNQLKKLVNYVHKNIKEHNQELLKEALIEDDVEKFRFAMRNKAEITKEMMDEAFEEREQAGKFGDPEDYLNKINKYDELKGYLLREAKSKIIKKDSNAVKKTIEKLPIFEQEDKKELKLFTIELCKNSEDKEYKKEILGIFAGREKTIEVSKEMIKKSNDIEL